MVKNGNNSLKKQARERVQSTGEKYTTSLRSSHHPNSDSVDLESLPEWVRTYLPLLDRLPDGWVLENINGQVMLARYGSVDNAGTYTWFFGSDGLDGEEIANTAENAEGFSPEDVGVIQNGVELDDVVAFSFVTIDDNLNAEPVSHQGVLSQVGFHEVPGSGGHVLIKGESTTDEFSNSIVSALSA